MFDHGPMISCSESNRYLYIVFDLLYLYVSERSCAGSGTKVVVLTRKGVLAMGNREGSGFSGGDR